MSGLQCIDHQQEAARDNELPWRVTIVMIGGGAISHAGQCDQFASNFSRRIAAASGIP
jgi:hypothetical protein